MPRLIDEMRASGKVGMPHWVAPKLESAWIGYARKIMPLLSDLALPVLLIDNVAEYFYSGTDQEYWSLDEDFPNIAPPFPQFWVEFKLVRMIHSETGDVDVSRVLPQGGRVGQLFTAIDPARARWEGELPEGTRWIYWCDMWVDYRRPGGGADGPYGATFVCVDAEGRAVGNPWMQSFAPASGNEDIMKSLMAWYNPALLAISFLHCKNVTMVDHVVDAKLAKRCYERQGYKPTGYKTLVIEPLKAILRQEGRAHEHGLAKAMHICRGHFRDYREGRGLFGKYHQLVWTPSVVRGTKGSAAPREIKVKV
jgi:hypothetical protein